MAFSETRFGWVHLEQPSKHWQSMLCHHCSSRRRQIVERLERVSVGCHPDTDSMHHRDGRSSCITDFPVA